MISHFDQHKNSPKQRRHLLAASFLSCAVCAAVPYASAQEGEEFAIKQSTGIQDDGGSVPITGVVNGIHYTVVQGFAVAQGDMVLGKVSPDGTFELPLQARGIGQSGTFERWPDGIVPYQFGADVSQIQRDRAIEAIAHWNNNTTLKLVMRDASNEAQYDNYINFQSSFGCASYVGRQGAEQEIWLADTCTVGSIIHELGHAIGLFHEHTRPDRDNFVTVNWDNVTTGKEINFETVDVGAANFSEYDYGSIMHYGEYFFSSNGQPSISVPDGVTVGQRDALSERDISSVDDMYATDLKLAVSSEQYEDNIRVDLVVSNIGALGANTLKLTAQLGDDADWLSVSNNSGWECLQFGAELRCTRDTLIERADSSFSLLVDSGSATMDELQVRLESRTKDSDPANNVFNDTLEPEPTNNNTGVTQEEPLVITDTGTATGTQTPTEPTVDESTDTQGSVIATSGNTTDGGNDTDVPSVGAANSGGSSGGGAGFYLLLLAFAARVLRPRTKIA